MKRWILLLLFITNMFGSDFNIELTNETLMFNTTIKHYIQDNNSVGLRGDYLYYDNENRSNYFNIGAEVEGKLEFYNSKFSIFMDYSHIKNSSALPIGFGFLFPQNKKFVNVEVGYAPKVLSFDEADKFFKAKIELGIVPIKKVHLILGYRVITFKKNYQSNLYLGAGFSF